MCTSPNIGSALYLSLLVLLVVVDLIVPEEGLVTISEEEVLRSEVLVWVFNALFQRRQMFPMFPMFVPQIPGVDASKDKARDNDIEGKSTPKITGSGSVSLYCSSFSIEGVVLSSNHLGSCLAWRCRVGAGEPSLKARSEGRPESWCTHLLRKAQADTLKRHCDCGE